MLLGVSVIPKVSIVMGIYNCECTLEKSINSILKQTYSDWELIMCDDASTDNTYEIAKRFECKYPKKIKLIKNETNLKLASTLNCCLKYAGGEYIARMDADDISKPQRFEKQVDFLDKNQEYSFVSSSVEYFDENGIWLEKTKVINYPEAQDFLQGQPFVHPATMFRKRDLVLVGAYRVAKEIRRTEDYDLFMRLYVHGFKGYNLQEVLFSYHVSKNDMKKRKYIYRIDEAIVRYKGFKALKLFPKGYIFIFKPLVVGLIPQGLLLKMKKWFELKQ